MGGRGEWTREIIKLESEPEFEYDPKKSKSNKEKHGIDFEEAKALWGDKGAIKVRSPYASDERYILIARHNEKYYTAIYTLRKEKIRIISVRSARNKEIEVYEQKNNSN
jgi:uncharacterized DUF497 family protein